MFMKKVSLVAVALAAVSFGGVAVADNVAQQTVTYAVSAINELEVSGNPGALTVSTATAGSAPNAVTDNSTTYNITTNEVGRKITGAITTGGNMDSGLILSVTLAAPTGGGTSTGSQTLTTTAADLVTGISTLNESGRTITYQLAATSAAGVVSSASKTVTFTITAGS